MCRWHLTLLMQRPTKVSPMCCRCADFKWCRNWNKVVPTDIAFHTIFGSKVGCGRFNWSGNHPECNRCHHLSWCWCNVYFSTQKTHTKIPQKQSGTISNYFQMFLRPLLRRRRYGRRKRSCHQGRRNIHIL